MAAKPTDFPVKFDPQAHKHLIVVRKNQFFKVVHEVDGRQLNTSELEAQFRRVYELAQRVPSVGILTTENRDIWADARQVLSQRAPGNKTALEAIESGAFSSVSTTLRLSRWRSARTSTGTATAPTAGSTSRSSSSLTTTARRASWASTA